MGNLTEKQKRWALCNQIFTCKCGHQWHPRNPKIPNICPKCKRKDWVPTTEENREYLVMPSSCWLWLGATSGLYGTVRVEGKSVPAHRYYYEIARGKIPDGQVVDHLCKNHLCVNPEHLEAISKGENSRRGGYRKIMSKSKEVQISTENRER